MWWLNVYNIYTYVNLLVLLEKKIFKCLKAKNGANINFKIVVEVNRK